MSKPHKNRRPDDTRPLPPWRASDADWTAAPTRAFSSPGTAPAQTETVDLGMDDTLQLSRPDGEPATLFDVNAPAPPREMRIAREDRGHLLREGHIINERFEIRRCLGVGNVGTVYLIHDLRLKDKKALKLMHPALVDDPLAAHRFIEEIKTLQQLSHEHIVRIYDFGRTDVGELAFFTMEYVAGTNLAELLKKKGGKLPVDKALGLLDQILDALSYAHQHTTHGRLKPINIMVRPTGRIVLLNFGLNEGTRSDANDRGRAVGDAHYQAPEQLQQGGAATPQADLYAAGAIGYQMLTGSVPIGQAPAASRVNKALPRRLDRVLARFLDPLPERRFASAEEARKALRKAAGPQRRLPRLLALAAIAAGALLLWWYLLAG